MTEKNAFIMVVLGGFSQNLGTLMTALILEAQKLNF